MIRQMTETSINDKILKKMEKFSSGHVELKMCKELLTKELRWSNIEDPPFKRDFLQSLNLYFPFKEN